MKERIIELLRCPASGHRLALKEEVSDKGEVREGKGALSGSSDMHGVAIALPG